MSSLPNVPTKNGPLVARSGTQTLKTRRADGSAIKSTAQEIVDPRPATIDVSRFMEDRSWPPGRLQEYLPALNLLIAKKVLDKRDLSKIKEGLGAMPADHFMQFATISIGLMHPDNKSLLELVNRERDHRVKLGQAVQIESTPPESFSLEFL